jgi:hypothetical protein
MAQYGMWGRFPTGEPHRSIAALAPYALKSSIFFPSTCLKDYVRMLEEVQLSNALNMARARAEASFKRKQEKAREGAKAWEEYEAQYRGVDQKIARLRALRLAKEAAEATTESNDAQQSTKKRRPSGSAAKPEREEKLYMT